MNHFTTTKIPKTTNKLLLNAAEMSLPIPCPTKSTPAQGIPSSGITTKWTCRDGNFMVEVEEQITSYGEVVP